MTNPWVRARATSAPAGLLACGSSLDARLPGQGLSSGYPEGFVHRAIRSQLQGQPRHKGHSPRTAFPIKLLAEHRRIHGMLRIAPRH